jgi:hypothetical protein
LQNGRRKLEPPLREEVDSSIEIPHQVMQTVLILTNALQLESVRGVHPRTMPA